MKTAGRIFTNSIFFAHIILIIAPMSIVMGSLFSLIMIISLFQHIGNSGNHCGNGGSSRAETDGFCKTHTGT